MGFLSPWFLLGAVAIGLPIWLHLLRQHRRTPMSFSSVMFFERRVQSSIQQRRLRYLLLLAMRVLVLLFLALAFASPFVNRKVVAATARTLTVIAVDHSFSMRYGNRMRQAKLRAAQELSALRGNTLAEIVAVDSRVEALTPPLMDRRPLLSAIESIEPTDLASSFGQFVRAMRVREQTTGMWLDVRFVSDMQQTSMPRSFKDLQMGPHTALHLISVAGSRAPNWAVEAVNASPHVYDPRSTQVTATISGWQTDASTKRASLLMDGTRIASKDIRVPPSGRAEVEFLGFNVPYGMHRAQVQVEGGDELAEDDAFPFSIERSDPRKVLFLSAAGRIRDPVYYRAAMESAPDTGLVIRPASLEQAASEDLAQYAFIVLNDVGALPPSTEQHIREYVQNGGSLFVALGPASAGAARAPVTADRYGTAHQVQEADFIDGQAAALRGVGNLANVRFFEVARLDPKPDARVLVKLADGSPLLIEERIGEGRVLTFGSGLDNVSNDFPLHTSFVPFVAQTGRYLAGNDESARTLVVGSQVELRAGGDNGAAASVIGPDGKSELTLNEAAKAVSFPLERNGFYEVQRAHGRRELVAVHADRRESDLTPIPEQTLALWRNMGEPVPASGKRVVEQPGQPWNMWRYALLLALAAALAESIIANRYLLKGRQPG